MSCTWMDLEVELYAPDMLLGRIRNGCTILTVRQGLGRAVCTGSSEAHTIQVQGGLPIPLQLQGSTHVEFELIPAAPPPGVTRITY